MKATARPRTLVHALVRSVEHTPDARAFSWLAENSDANDELTYAQLGSRAGVIAARLRQSAQPGDRALLLYGPGLEFVAALLGCLCAGVVAVPAYPPRNKRHHPRLDAIVGDAQPRCLLTDRSNASKLDEWLVRLPSPIECIDTSRIETISGAVLSDALPRPEDLALLQYTSGSTSTPKGVMVTHGNIARNSDALRRAFRLSTSSVSVCWLPSFHDMGLIDGVVQPLFTGFPGYLMAPSTFIQRPATWLEAIGRYRATHCGGPNFGFDACVQSVTDEQVDGLDLSSWETAYNGAEPIRPETLAAFQRKFARRGFLAKQFYPCYGLAEATLIVTGSEVDAEPVVFAAEAGALEQHQVREATPNQPSRSLVGCGTPVHETDVRIVHPETRRACADDEVGEIWVSGSSVAAGYWRRPDATEESFGARLADGNEGPFLRTGDLGFVRNGELFVAGRIKDLVIIRGRNHYPQDLEATSRGAHPALARALAAAFSIDDAASRDEERLVIVQEVPRAWARRLDPDAFLNAIRSSIIEEHDVDPFDVVLVPALSLPKTSSGKLQRRESARRFRENEFTVLGRLSQMTSAAASRTPTLAAPSPATTATETDIINWLKHAISRLLSIDEKTIDISRPFASLGLDSLTAVRLSGELQQWLGQPVPATLAYDYPTVSALAAHLAGSASEPRASSAHDETRRTGGPDEPIAIVGIGCRFPGARGPEAFWRLLRDGIDGTSDVPHGRWRSEVFDPEPGRRGKLYTTRGGFLNEIDAFDAGFFGISPNEADRMDPQQRLLLETTWEALEDAGIPPVSLEGTDTGVFVGISTADYRALQFATPNLLDHLAGTGNAASISANRISYLLDLQGPSLTVDTACSSSLLAVHLACESLRRGECDVATAGGVNLMLSADLSVAFSQARMLAPDGRCKTFDAAADGYVRGEGCGMVVLKRLSDATRDGDRIAAVIAATAVNQDGRTNGLTAPNGVSQQRVLRKALKRTGLAPFEIEFIEAHGTGTSLGDPIEMHALCAVFGEGRTADHPLYVGSVKTNIGHLEAAAGVAALIKTALALREGVIPPHLNFAQWNPMIDLGGVPVCVPVAAVPLRGGGRHYAGVSSFGFGGTNVHAVLASAPSTLTVSRSPHAAVPLLFSAKTDSALRALAERYRDRLRENEDVAVEDLAFTALAGRASFAHRLGVTGQTRAELADAIEHQLRVPWRSSAIADRPRIAFLFTGQGSQRAGAAAALYRSTPVFRDVIDRCAAWLRDHGGIDLLPLMLDASRQMEHVIAETRYTQPALYALQCGLTAVWRSWGVEADAVMGHSVGEFAAAFAAGVFELEEGLALITTRGRLMDERCQPGAMAAIGAPADLVERMARDAGLDIAAYNGPKQIVVSGTNDAIAHVLAECERLRISAARLKTVRGFHSTLMEPALGEFERAAASLTSRAPRIAWISNVTGQSMIGAPDTSYWTRHARQPVRFADGVSTLDALGINTFIEIGPDPVLLALARRTISDRSCLWLPSLTQRDAPDRRMAETAATLYVAGCDLNGRGLFPTARRVAAPTYPFARDRHWFEAEQTNDVANGDRSSSHSRDTDATTAASFYEVAWERHPFRDTAPPLTSSLRDVVAVREPELRAAASMAHYPEALAALEAIAVGYAEDAFAHLASLANLREDVEVEIDSAERFERLGIAPRHRRLATRLLRMLPASAAIDGRRVPDTHRTCRDLVARFPEVSQEARLLERCGGRLAEVLQGAIDPLHLLFPGGDFGAAAALYADAAVARLLNTQAAAALEALLQSRDRADRVRILEAGAGTGGLTAYLLPVLAAWGGDCEYIFSDLSPSFLEDARARFSAYPFVHYRLLDLERLDSIESSSHDIVIAANAVHAVAHVTPVLRGLHAALKPGGQIWLLEGVQPQVWLDLTFGLTEGWWRAADGDGRSDYPLLALGEWITQLGACGFVDALELSASGDVAPYALIAASRPASPDVSREHARWIWGATPGPLRDAMAHRLLDRTHVNIAIDVAIDSNISATFEQRLDAALAPGDLSVTTNVALVFDAAPTFDAETTDRQAVELSLRFISAVRSASHHPDTKLWIVTRGARALPEDDRDPAAGGAISVSPASVLWGLAKTTALEFPEIWGGIIDLDPVQVDAASADDEARRLISELTHPSGEDQQLWRSNARWVPRLSAIPTPATAASSPRGAVLITGGTGALGLQTALGLARTGYREICLMSRGGPTAPLDEQILAEIRELGAHVSMVHGDAANADDVDRAIHECERDGLELRGVVHAAGMPHARPLLECRREDLHAIYHAKLRAPLVLLARTERHSLDFFIVFSSMVALWGAKGQGIYAAGNQFLDDLAVACRRAGRNAFAINWGPVSGGGMVPADELARLPSLGVRPLALTTVSTLLMRALTMPGSDAAVIDIDWSIFRSYHETRAAKPFFSRVGAPRAASLRAAQAAAPPVLAAADASSIRTLETLAVHVRAEVAAVLGHGSADRVDVDRGFFEIGLDSLTIIQLKTRLEQALGLTLPSTLALEYPTVTALAKHLFDITRRDVSPIPPKAGLAPAASGRSHISADEPIAIVGIGCRFPGRAVDPASFWTLLRDGVDAVGPFPENRWGAGPPHSTDPDRPGSISTRNGGFLDRVDLFDAAFFGVSAREAANMDPQHRLLLHVAWETLEDAGAVYPRSAAARVGVFVGVSASDYARRIGGDQDWKDIDAYYATGNALNAAPGRISYLFGFRGPSIAIDTACSSSLVAIRLACQSLRSGECDAALAGGVNLILSSETTVSLSRAGVLSPDGRCRTFDATADGMARAEGCGLVMLKPLSKAIVDRDRIYATIRAAAVNQDGPSGGFTVPSREAQEDLIRRAIALSDVSPSDVDYVEAHGTGTPLGDPIEVRALAAVFRDSHTSERPLRIGSVKTNLGHTESASGVAGIIKTALALHHHEIPPQLHFHTPSSHIDWDHIPIHVVTQRTMWPSGKRPRIAGVSSFGLSGTNAHVVLEEAPAALDALHDPSHRRVPIVLSAKTPDALADQRRRLADFLTASPEFDLIDVAYTLTARRTPLACRWALGCATTSEAIARLRDSEDSAPAATDDADAIAGSFARGEHVDWHGYWLGREGRVTSLPTYPFRYKSYWKERGRSTLNAIEADTTSRVRAGISAQETPVDPLVEMDHFNDVQTEVVRLVATLLEEPAASLDVRRPFLEMGADSIVLMEAIKAVERRFGVELSVRQMFESLTTIGALSRYIFDHRRASSGRPTVSSSFAAPAPAARTPERTSTPIESGQPPAGWEQVIDQQFRHVSQLVSEVVRQQLEFLGGRTPSSAKSAELTAPAPASLTPADASPASFWKQEAPTRVELTAEQQAHIDRLVERYVERTAASKAREQTDRPVFADMRTAIGFRLETKEISYPIIAARSHGSAFEDLDGNRYVDMCMGFGVALFGHQPPFVIRAIEEQLREGIQVGPQSRHAADVARMICALTGMDRVTFCNTGTEAVMTAIRVARAATGKQRIVTFSGSYHGHSDTTLALARNAGANPVSVPMAPGVSPAAIADTLVLPYDLARSLEIIEKHADSLAAVLVEPVQSRRPGLHPAEFLRQVREITRRHGVPLIFDEMITGFRIHAGGAQAHFGIEADIATYGKLIGGGLPLGVVAARGNLLDRIDGGAWTYGDDSYPATERTFYAGTFCKHPLSMAAARAVLAELTRLGPALQEELNQRTADFVASVNAIFAAEDVSLSLVHFGSLMRFNMAGNFTYLYQPLEMDLFCHHLIERGVYIWEGRTLFLSTEHSDHDLDIIRRAIQSSVRDLKAGGFFASTSGTSRQPAVIATPIEETTAAPVAAAHKPDHYALTETQRDLWVMAQMGPDGSNAYQETIAADVRGGVEPASFAAALRWLVTRHEALRVVIDAEGQRQRIQSDAEIDCRFEDLSRETHPDAALQRRLDAETEEAFDLQRGPLLRARVWTIGEDRTVIALYTHHIVADGWSMGLILNELGAAYEAFSRGGQPSLPPAPGFGDYLNAREARLNAASVEPHRAYWRDCLAAPLPALDLPTDRARPPVKTFTAVRTVRTLPRDLHASLRILSAKHGCSVFMTMLAGHLALLHRLAGEPRDLIVGVPVSGREGDDDARLAGFCTHILPVRVSVDPSQSFSSLMRSVRSALLEAFDHQEWPFGRMLDDITIDPDLSRTPVFTTTFNLDRPLRLSGFGGLPARLFPLPAHYATYDLAFNIVIDGEDVVVGCDSNRDLWEPSTIGRWIDHYGTLLDAVAKDASLLIGDLPLDAETDRHRMLVTWNATDEALPSAPTLHQWVEEQAARTPNAEVVRCAGESVTYAQLMARADRIAASLGSRGGGPGTLVGVSLRRSIDLVAALLAVLKTGAAYVPLDPRFPVARLGRMVEHSGMRLILSDAATGELLRPMLSASVELLNVSSVLAARRLARKVSNTTRSSDPAYVMYTSASTGEPKGVAVPHHAVINLLQSMARRLQPASGDAWLAATTVSFDISVLEIFLPLVSGFRLLLADDDTSRDGRLLAGAMRRDNATFFQATPSGWRMLLESGWDGDPRLTMLCGGEALPIELARTLLTKGKALWNVYGPTEATIWSTAGLVRRESLDDSGVVSIGRPLGNTHIYVMDSGGKPQPPGVPGEIYIGGAGLARGYHRDEQATRERFVTNPLGGPSPRLYRTGDLGRWSAAGDLECLGRLDHQVKVRGFRIELGEIEMWLSRFNGISEAVAHVRESAAGERNLAAYFTVQPGLELSTDDIRRHLAAHLPDYMLPDTLARLDLMPRTPNGKVDRRALPAIVASSAASQAPVTATEQVIAALWKELLHIADVGADDDFLSLGGNSLLAARLGTRLSAAFGVVVTLRSLLEHRTVRRMATLIESLQWAAGAIGPDGPSDQQVEITL